MAKRALDEGRIGDGVGPGVEPGAARRELLDRIALLAREALDADAALISLGESLPLFTAASSFATFAHPIHNDPNAAAVVGSGETLAIGPEDLSIAPRRLPSGYRGYLAAPVPATGEGPLAGTLAVLTRQARAWTSRDRSLISTIARTASCELASVELAAELEAANAHLDRAHSELERERVQLREMIRMAPAFIAVVEGPDAVFTLANDPFYRLVGQRELIGRPLREGLPEVAGQGVLELVEQVYRDGNPVGAEEAMVRLEGPDGKLEERFVSFVYQPLIGPEWGVSGVLVCGIDLTQQVGMRKAAEAAAGGFRLMAETIHQVFWTADAKAKRLLYVSPALESIWGITREEALERNGWLHTIVEEDRERVRAVAEECLGGGEMDVEYRISRADGSIRWVRDRAYPIFNEQGESYRIVGIAEDMTERRTLEMQLRQSQKMEAVGRLAGGIAHDFNNMLTAITGHAQLLELEIPEDSSLRSHIDVIRMAADRSADLTRQLLAFSRKQILQPQVIDLNGVIHAIEPMLRRMIGEDVGITADLTRKLSPVFADPGQIEQVLMNLILNARDAMPDGGDILISTRETELNPAYFSSHSVEVKPGRYAMLAVSDSGVGMDKLTQARVFEPFFTTKPVGKGTGLGLSTVYGIVKQTGGLVWVYTEPGVGSTFKVYLPLAPDSTDSDQPATVRTSLPPEGTTVFVVEDDESVRTLVVRILERAGYEVHQATDGLDALRAIAGGNMRIDLLLTDVVLPTMSGREVANVVAARHPEARILFMSGYTDDAIVHHGVLDAGTEFIEKPFTPDALLRRISSILRHQLQS